MTLSNRLKQKRSSIWYPRSLRETGVQPWTVDTQQSQTISGFITPQVYVRWTGYHGTDFQCASQNQIYGYWSKDSGLVGSWKVSNRNAYETYKQYYN